jgi:apolipoprotein N-acyltransferase
MRSWLVKLLCASASGALLFLASADFDIWPLAWVMFVPLLVALRSTPPRRAFLWGWLAGLVANAGGFYWIQNLLQRFGHLGWFPSLVLFLLLAAYQGIHFGAFAAIVRWIKDRSPRLPMTLLAPVVMTGLELLMPFIFPWYIAISQAWVTPVIQIADLTGPLGVTFLLLLVSGLCYDLITARMQGLPWPGREILVTAAVLALALGYGGIRLAQVRARWTAAPKVKVGVVQANIGIVEKGRASLAAAHLRLHQEESRTLVARGADLVVWPESSYPYAFDRAMDRDWPPGHRYQVMQDLRVPLLFGTITYGREDKYPHNSAYMMEPDGRITGRFDKNFLLVFGEYIPFYEHIPSFKKWFPAASNFSRGTEVTTFPFRTFRLAPLICYEDIIPDFGRRVAPLRPNLLVNVTNDAWFGRTSEPYEHLALAVFRSVELRLGMVRAVNTGVSAFVDATGKVYAKTKSYDPVATPGVPPASLLEEVAMMPEGRTVYAAVGDLFGTLNLAGTVALLVVAGRRRQGTRGRRSSKRRRRT